MAIAARITWNYALSDHTGFLLQRSVDTGSSWAVNFPQPITTSYVDATVVPNGTYWYRIAATNQYGTGAFSNTGSVFVPPPTSSAPYNLQVNSGSAILTWVDGGSYGDYYAVQRAVGGGGFTDLSVTLIETYTDSAATSSYSGESYSYRVADVNMTGTSSFSNTASITFQWSPNPPQNLQITSGSAILTWESGSSGVDAYVVQRSLNGVAYSGIASTGSLGYTDDNITASYDGVRYYYRVYASNAAGTSSNSNVVNYLFGWPPPPPIDFLAESGSVVLTWTFVSASNQTASIERSVDGTNFYPLTAVPGAQETYTDTTATASYVSTSYWYRVLGATQFGYSGWSTTASIALAWVPPAPQNLIVNSGSAQLSWSYGSLGTPVTYSIERSTDGVSYNPYSAAITTSYLDTGVTAETGSGNIYYYRVVAISGIATSSYSNTASITFTYNPPPSGPIELNVASGSVLVSWTSSIANADRWDIYRSFDPAPFGYLTSSFPATKSFRDNGVIATFSGSNYIYEVVAVNAYGSSSFSNTASIMLARTPTAPSGLVVNSGSALLDWTASQGHDTYAIQRSIDGVVYADYDYAVTNSYTDFGATGSYSPVTYWYQVGAVNQWGTSSFSNTASITFLWAPPEPYDLVVHSGSAHLGWTASILPVPVTFSIERSVNASAFAWQANVGSATYTDGDVLAASGSGNNYSYRVTTQTAYSSSLPSVTASINFTYDPPTGSITLNATSGSSNVSWTSSIANATTWNIFQSVNGSPLTPIASVAASTYSYTDVSVSASYEGNTYSYAVNAENIYRTSSLSNTASLLFGLEPLPPVLDPITSGSAILTWVSQSNGVDHYLLWRSFYGTPGTYEYLATTTASTYTDTDVTCSMGGQTYWYAVDASSSFGTSSLSNTQSITFTCTGNPPEAPLSLTVTSGSAIVD